MMVKAISAVLLGLASCAFFVNAADAAGDATPYSIEDVTACSPDAMRLCKDKIPDIEAIEACMKVNYENLRPACKVRFSKPR